MADIERRRQNYATALAYLKEAVKSHQDLNDQLRAGVSVGDIGNVYYDLGNYQLAFEKTLEALKVLDTVQKEPWRKADLKRQIGRIEYARENYSSSIRYLKDALKLYEETDDNVWQAYTLNDIANSYYDSDSLDTAINYYNKALELAEQYELLDTQANVWSNLGGINTIKENFDLARDQINKALAFNQQNKDLQSVLHNYLSLSQLELKSKNRKEALQLANRGIKLSDSIKAPNLKKSFFYQRSDIYKEQKKFKKAYDNLSSFVVLNDSLNKVNNAKQIDELKIIYETEQKEKELIIQQKEIILLKERQQKAEIQKWFIIITALGILAFAIAVIYGLRQKMQGNKLIREQLDKDLEFKEKELTTHALHLAHKNEILLDLKKQLKDLKSKGTNSYQYQKIINNINLDINNDNNWQQFRSYFEEVHKDFNANILKTYPEVSNNDLRLMSLLKMNLSSKEIANILNISMEGVKKARYRLRKKLNLSTEESLQELVIEL
jgi:tetratricopeptide (TPR) repeat protein